MAIKRSPWEISDVSPRLKDDRDMVIEAVKENGCCIRFASERLKNDIDLARLALENNPYAASDIPRKIYNQLQKEKQQ